MRRLIGWRFKRRRFSEAVVTGWVAMEQAQHRSSPYFAAPLARPVLTAKPPTQGWGVGQSIGQNPWPARLAVAVLVGAILYLLIGTEPYVHESSLSPIDPDLTGGVASPLNRDIWFALTSLSAPLIWLRRNDLPQLLKRSWPLLVLLAWFAATTTWALDPTVSHRRLILLVCEISICTACCTHLRTPRAIHGALALGSAIIVLIDLASWIFLPRLSQTEIGLACIHTHKNSLGLAMMFAEFVTVPYVISQKTWPARAFWGFIVVAAFALLVASLSKTSLGITVVALLVAPIVLAILSRRPVSLLGMAMLTLTMVALAALGWLVLSFEQGTDPLAPIRGLTFTKRTDVWAFVIEQIRLRPWTGAGFGSFWDINPAVQPGYQTDLWFFQPGAAANEAHEGYLDILVTTGVFGLLGSIFVIFRWSGHGLKLLHSALRSDDPQLRDAIPYLSYLAIFPILIAVHNFTESSFFSTPHLFNFVILLSGMDVELLYPRRPAWVRPRIAINNRQPVIL